MTNELAILQLDKTQSYPPTTGSEVRSWKTAEKLSELGTLWRASPWDGHTQLPNDIHLIGLSSPIVSSKLIRNDAWYGGFATQSHHLVQQLITWYVVSQVSKADADFDVVVSEAPELTDPARRIARSQNARLVLNKHNCYFDFLAQYLRDKHLPTAVRKRAVRNLRRYEQQGINEADVVVFQSDGDADRFDVPSSVALKVIPNGTDYEAIQRGGDPEKLARELGIPDDRLVCLFVGSFDYEPNHAAARVIIDEFAPAFPKMSFLLVGRNPPKTTAQNVYAPGFVDDLVDALELADIALCPLPRGSGTKLKMLDYLAAGLPIVTTSIGAQGLPIRDEEHAVVRNDPDGMKTAVRELAVDDQRRGQIAMAGHKLGEQFAWSRLLKGYDDVINKP